MSAFSDHVYEIFSTAREGGAEECDLALLLGRDGSVRLVGAEGWDVEALRRAEGAAEAIHIRRGGGRVRVEGGSPGERCLFETADSVLRSFPGWLPARLRSDPPISCPNEPRALTARTPSPYFRGITTRGIPASCR